jgi:hypothetical protein
MDLIKDIVKEKGICDIIEDYKYQLEYFEKYNKVIEEIKDENNSRYHIRCRLIRKGLYRYCFTKSPNDVLLIHNFKTNGVWRLYNYGDTFNGKSIITYRKYCEILPIYSNFR